MSEKKVTVTIAQEFGPKQQIEIPAGTTVQTIMDSSGFTLKAGEHISLDGRRVSEPAKETVTEDAVVTTSRPARGAS